MKTTKEFIISGVAKEIKIAYQDNEMAKAAILFKKLDAYCDRHNLEMPIEAIDINVPLDEFFKCDILAMDESRLFDNWFHDLAD